MFKDDMICDDIENCVQYINNFNPEKSSNPFAYFTQIVHYVSEAYSEKKKQLEIKEKIIEKTGFENVFVSDGELTIDQMSEYNTIKDNVRSRLR